MSTRMHCQCGNFADIEHACPVTYAKLREQLAAERSDNLQLREILSATEESHDQWKQRAEVAEAKLNALDLNHE